MSQSLALVDGSLREAGINEVICVLTPVSPLGQGHEVPKVGETYTIDHERTTSNCNADTVMLIEFRNQSFMRICFEVILK